MEIFRAPDMRTGAKLGPKKFDKRQPDGCSDRFPIQLASAPGLERRRRQARSQACAATMAAASACIACTERFCGRISGAPANCLKLRAIDCR